MSNAYVIEAMLLRWGESHASGKTVTFVLPEDDGPHPFKGMKCGPDNGQRVALSVALINDDETQTEPDLPKAKEPQEFRTLKRAQQAGILCNEDGFQRWLGCEHGVRFEDSPWMADDAATAVRRMCGVNSRADLDTIPGAGDKWDSIVTEYRAWPGVSV